MNTATVRPFGFWRSWALVVGTMIGSGIFTLPSLLAPYGFLSLIGWMIAAFGVLCIAFSLASLAARSPKSGGPYAYVTDALGRLPGFLVAWGLWVSFWVSLAAIALAFSGYFQAVFPGISNIPFGNSMVALIVIWGLILNSLRGMQAAGVMQLLTTVLKLLPLGLIIVLGLYQGNITLPEMIESERSWQDFIIAIASVVMLSMWAFLGIEAATIPASETQNPSRTIPKALLWGLTTVVAVYLLATLAIWATIPQKDLIANSQPFHQAARLLIGDIGAQIISVGIMISLLGALNGILVLLQVIPTAMADNGVFPTFFAHRNGNNVTTKSLLVAGSLATALIILNASDNLSVAFEFAILLSTMTALLPYLMCTLADIIQQWRQQHKISLPKFVLAVLGCIFSAAILVGAGLTVLGYGTLLLVAGLPIYAYSVHQSKKVL